MTSFHHGTCIEGLLEGSLYPNVHFLNRQAAREKLAAMRALTESARARHLALAEDYRKRADEARAADA